jgi:peptidoglycan/LPS O-acetylase OafA/YrhL
VHHRAIAKNSSILEAAVVAVACAFMAYAGDSRWTFLAPFVFGAMVFVFAAEQGWVSRILQQRAFVALGTLSYSIYMTHPAVYMWLHRGYRFIAPRLGIDSGALPASGPFQGNVWAADALLLSTVVAVLLVSLVTDRNVEQPGRRAFNRVAARREAESPAPQLA